MEKILRLFLLVLLSVVSSMSLSAQAIPPDSLYLGQTPPGNTPIIFNLPITSGLRPVERISITSDGKEIYYSELNTYPPTIQNTKCLKYLDNRWQGPFTVFVGYQSPRLSVDDSTMYVEINNNGFATTYYSKRISAGWSTPIKIISAGLQSHYFQTTGLNNSYLSSKLPNAPSHRDICRLIINNSDTLMQGLGTPINTTYDENDFFVADDESYMIFSRTNSKASDMYISFKKGNDRWTNPKDLGAPINKPGYIYEYGQFISKDGKYLFFTSGGLSMGSYYTYWVKIDNIIDSLKHNNFVPYLNYQIPAQLIHVGKLFTYTVPDSTFVDDDGNNTLTYSAAQSDGNLLPSWLSFDTLTRTFSGTPTGASIVSINLSAKDSANVIIPCVFDINITTVNVIEKTKEQIPKSINLFQNYPNPFNPTTTIEFAISKTGRYTLDLYNTLGELVKEISDKEYEAGYYKKTFNATGLSSGMYFYRLTGNDANIVRKMVLLR